MDPLIAVLGSSFQTTLSGVVMFIPNFVVALVIFLVGWVIGVSFEKVIAHVVRAIKIDSALETVGLAPILARADMKLDVGKFLGVLVKWFIIITFLIAAFEVMGLVVVNDFLKEVVLLYIPQVIIATLILLVAAMAASVVQRVVVSSTKTAGLEIASFLGALTSWAIWIFGFIFALAQLGIAEQFMQILFAGLVFMLSLAGGLAFGLGGREHASRFLDKLRANMSEKR